MNCPEAITQEILGIQSFNVLELLGQMTFWRIIAEDVLYHKPYLLRAEKYTALQMMNELQLLIIEGLFRYDLPNIAAMRQCLDVGTRRRHLGEWKP